MTTKLAKRVVVTNVERDLFSSIYIDQIFIRIGKKKIEITRAGIFNQVCDYFNSRRRLNKFLWWLAEEHDCDPLFPIPDVIKQEWETKLLESERTNIYSEILRVKRLNVGFEFYALTGHGSELVYLCSTHDSLKPIVDYLWYNEYVNKICTEKEIDHPLEKSITEIKADIHKNLRHKLIPLVENVAVLANSINKYCMGYYSLKRGDVNAPTPAWDNFIIALPDDGTKECFMAWIYSIFKEDNFGRQVLWLHGKGESGKSKVVQAIHKKMYEINPNIVTSLEPLQFMDRFSAASYVKKRLTIGQDIVDRYLVRNQLVKNITGNDNSSVIKKGQDKSDENIYSKVLVSSNVSPWVSIYKSEEISRMLYIHVDPELSIAARKKWDVDNMGDWGKCLIAETDDFIAKCEAPYHNTLDEDKQNIVPYPTMGDKLFSTSFITDNLKLWWPECIRPCKASSRQQTNVIYYDQLCKDYSRFLGKRAANGKYERSIEASMLAFLVDNQITVHRLVDINKSLYILGFEFIEEILPKRATLDKLLSKKALEISKSGQPEGVVYAMRIENNIDLRGKSSNEVINKKNE